MRRGLTVLTGPGAPFPKIILTSPRDSPRELRADVRMILLGRGAAVGSGPADRRTEGPHPPYGAVGTPRSPSIRRDS